VPGEGGAGATGSLTVGDQVTAYDPSTGKTSTQTVQHVWINHDHDLLDVTLRTEQPQSAADNTARAPSPRRGGGGGEVPVGEGATATFDRGRWSPAPRVTACV
jgi:hypothetical protein